MAASSMGIVFPTFFCWDCGSRIADVLGFSDPQHHHPFYKLLLEILPLKSHLFVENKLMVTKGEMWQREG